MWGRNKKKVGENTKELKEIGTIDFSTENSSQQALGAFRARVSLWPAMSAKVSDFWNLHSITSPTYGTPI